MNFLEDIKPYENAVLPGVRLPQIKIENKYYKAFKKVKLSQFSAIFNSL